MNGESVDVQATTLGLEAMREDLDFFQRLLTKPEELIEKRGALLNYCAEQLVSERQVWWSLALFRERGAAGFLHKCPPNCDFDLLRNNLKRQILGGIAKLPLETLTDFRELVTFVSRFLDRVQFLGDFLIHLFLDREKGPYRESQDMSGYIEFLVQKMFREIDTICEITNFNLFSTLNDRYAQWLEEKLADEEVLI